MKIKLKVFMKVFLFILFIVISAFNFLRIDSVSHSASDTLRPFIIQSVLLFILLFSINYFIAKSKKLS